MSCSRNMAALAAPETRMLAVVLSEVAVVDESGCSALVKHDIMPASSTVSVATRLIHRMMRTLPSTNSTQLIEAYACDELLRFTPTLLQSINMYSETLRNASLVDSVPSIPAILPHTAEPAPSRPATSASKQACETHEIDCT